MNTDNIKELVVLKNTLRILSTCYLFPPKKEINNPKYNVYKGYVVFCLISSYVPLGNIIHLVLNIKNGTPNYVDQDLMFLLSFFGTGYFNFRFLTSNKMLIELFKRYSDFDTFGMPTKFTKVNKLLNKVSIYYLTYHVMAVTGIVLTSVFLEYKCVESNLVNNITETCGLITRTWLPFEYDYFPVKQILLLYQFFGTFLTLNNAGIISYCMMETIVHLSVKFDHLCDTFIAAIKEQDPLVRKKRFGKAVKYHQALLELGDMINHCFSPSMMVHIILTAPVLGCSGYRLMIDHPIDATCLFFSWIISTSLVCTGGQALKDSSESLGAVLYQTEWYKVDTELQKDIMLIISRTRQPILLTAGPFGSMSFVMMVTIAKTSYSYLNLITQTM